MLVETLTRLAPPLRFAPRRNETRTEEQLREHYLIERELAERLRQAPGEARRTLYPEVYNELLRRVPHHPQRRSKFDPEALEERARAVEWQWRLLSQFFTPHTVFMEIGAGDCALSLRAAGYVERVYAVEVSEEIVNGVLPPSNMRIVLSDGLNLPVPENSVDFCFSDQLMEHLHPDDAKEQLRNIYRSLAPGGRYFCVTPNRMYGPRDISGYFDEVATGLHLHEYSAREIRKLLLDAGFSRVCFYAGARGYYARVSYWFVSLVEATLQALSYRLRKPIADWAPMRALLGLRVAAMK
jgi:SAM-dependent methyltransferase